MDAFALRVWNRRLTLLSESAAYKDWLSQLLETGKIPALRTIGGLQHCVIQQGVSELLSADHDFSRFGD
jgi:hypothetical protein